MGAWAAGFELAELPGHLRYQGCRLGWVVPHVGIPVAMGMLVFVMVFLAMAILVVVIVGIGGLGRPSF
jgi:hypothetical protein